MTMPSSDDVVLLDESGRPVASVSRSAVHPTEKPVHLFCSCHVLNSSGQVLLTRRRPSANGAAWTSSFDGHPREAEPGELGEAIRSRPWDFSPSLVFQASVLPLLGGSSAGLASSGRRTEHRALA